MKLYTVNPQETTGLGLRGTVTPSVGDSMFWFIYVYISYASQT